MKQDIEVYISHEDSDGDGITDYVAVYSNDFGGEPLFGDFRGVELCRTLYIPANEESVARAVEIARSVVSAEQQRRTTFFNEEKGKRFANPYAGKRQAETED